MIDLRAALRLYLVADPEQCDGDLPGQVEHALLGGVTMVQLRGKHLSDLDFFSLASEIRAVCARQHVPFLVNDRVDIALAVKADGVHLGVDDLPLEAARTLAGKDFLIGYSPETNDQLRTASQRGANYLGIGPVFGTVTKADAGQALGWAEFSRRVNATELPTVGIGGITVQNYRSVLTAGADGIAVVSAILRSNDAGAAASQLSRN